MKHKKRRPGLLILFLLLLLLLGILLALRVFDFHSGSSDMEIKEKTELNSSQDETVSTVDFGTEAADPALVSPSPNPTVEPLTLQDSKEEFTESDFNESSEFIEDYTVIIGEDETFKID